MDLELPSGLIITECERMLRWFVEEEYQYYDGIPSSDPNHITPLDVIVTNAMNSRVSTAPKIRSVHRGLAATCDSILARIPEHAHLLDDTLDERLMETLFTAACSVPDVLLSVATKVLHRKRRNLIPMLDNVLLKHYVGKEGDKKTAPQVGMTALRKFRDDLHACRGSVQELQTIVSKEGYFLSEVRILETLLWMEIETQGYYRTKRA